MNTPLKEIEDLFVIILMYGTVKTLRSALGTCRSQKLHKTPVFL